MKSIVCWSLLVSFVSMGIAWADPAPGDRHNDQEITFPAAMLLQNGGPIIDIKQPAVPGMHAAVGDGKTDDTAAFQDVYDLLKQHYEQDGAFATTNSIYVYIPNGTYLVSDTILYRGAPANWHNWDICKVRFIGQSRAKTMIKLADQCAPFQDANKPQPVVAYQHPDSVFNNGPGGNELENITINTGKGNPGAVGVMFQGANQTTIRNVSITSGDGAGKYGIWFKVGSVQGYYSDISIEGFDYGIFDIVNPEGDPAFEYLTLKDQNIAGIGLNGGGLSLRAVDSDQSAHNVPGLIIDESGAQAVLLDSSLHGGAATQPAIRLTKREKQCLFARNISTAGYGEAIQVMGETAVAGPAVTEYVSSPVKTLSDGQKTESLNLPVQDTPPVAWGDPSTDWAIADDFPTIQDAMNSGKSVIIFKKHVYDLKGEVIVPPSVKRIDLFGAEIKGATLVVKEPSADPLVVEEGRVPVRDEAQRDIVERCMGGNLSNPKSLPLTFYLENCNDIASGAQFCPTGAKIFARQIDVEYGNVPQIVCSGGTLWIFGFKTEDKKAAQPFVVTNGGTLEVLGGYVNMLGNDHPVALVTNTESNVSITCFTNMAGLYTTAIQETLNGSMKTAMGVEFPLRGGVYHANYVVPLYVGRKEP